MPKWWLSFILRLNIWIIKCISHSTFIQASIKWTVSIKSKATLALVQTSAKTKRGERSFPFTFNSVQFITRA